MDPRRLNNTNRTSSSPSRYDRIKNHLLRWKGNSTALLLVLPAIFYILYFSVYPAVSAVYESFQTPLSSNTLANYQGLLFLGLTNAFSNTIIVSFGALAFQFFLGFIIAGLLAREFRGKRVFMTITIIPWGVATIVSAFIFKNIFTTSGGYMNSFIGLFGVPSLNWNSSYALEVLVIILSDSWKNTPIVALILLAGMTGISQELYKAAAVDGAGPFRRFLFVTLPNLRNFILIALVIRGISEFNIFVLPLVLVPYNDVKLLSTMAFQFDSTSTIYYSYAASTLLLTIVLVFALAAVKLRRTL